MSYGLFMGCKIPVYLEHYGTSTRAVLKALGIRTVDLPFNCCGYPNRDLHLEGFVLSAARNIALAEKKKLDILTPCKCCYGSLRHAAYLLRENRDLRETINEELKKDGLRYRGTAKIRHLLTVLAEDAGVEAIKKKIQHPLTGLRVAAHYGCHALRPSEITQFDNPFSPTVFETIIAATGAETVDWPRRLDCCGNPLWERNPELSMSLTRTKLVDAKESGAQAICTACTYCQLQFDTLRAAHGAAMGVPMETPAVLVTQLLGLAMGLPEKKLGIEKNVIPFSVG